MDYTKIEASSTFGPIIGQTYMDASPFITTLARAGYASMLRQVEQQFKALPVKIQFQEEDPYRSAEEMFADVDRGLLKIYATPEEQAHPILGRRGNDMFRAVHDFHGHYMTRRDFSRHGEEAAWVRHSQMFKGLGRRAMTSETRGQSSAFIWVNGGREFPPQKAVLLPDWISEIPSQWR
jgi:hypothetical protein